MNGKTVMVTVLSLALVIASYGLAQAHGGMSGGGSSGGWFGTGSGHRSGPGQNPTGSGGNMMGPGGGMMGYGRGMMGGPGWDQMGESLRRLFSGQEDRSSNPALDEHRVNSDQARRVVEYRLGDNPYLRIGQMKETTDGFEFDIVTKKSGELVDRLFVERNTGHMYSLYNR